MASPSSEEEEEATRLLTTGVLTFVFEGREEEVNTAIKSVRGDEEEEDTVESFSPVRQRI